MKYNNIIKKVSMVCFIYTLIYTISGFILRKFNMQYRPWLDSVSFIIIGIFIISFILIVTRNFYNSSKLLGKIVRNSFLIFTILVLILLSADIFNPEKIIYKNGKLKVEVMESSFLMVDTRYYRYINLFLMGKDGTY